jgi:hypothetical protein
VLNFFGSCTQVLITKNRAVQDGTIDATLLSDADDISGVSRFGAASQRAQCDVACLRLARSLATDRKSLLGK